MNLQSVQDAINLLLDISYGHMKNQSIKPPHHMVNEMDSQGMIKIQNISNDHKDIWTIQTNYNNFNDNNIDQW